MLQTTTREIAQSWFTTNPEATEPRAIAIIAGGDDKPPLPAHVLELIADRLEAPVQLYFSSVRRLRTFQASKADSACIALVITGTPLSGALEQTAHPVCLRSDLGRADPDAPAADRFAEPPQGTPAGCLTPARGPTHSAFLRGMALPLCPDLSISSKKKALSALSKYSWRAPSKGAPFPCGSRRRNAVTRNPRGRSPCPARPDFSTWSPVHRPSRRARRGRTARVWGWRNRTGNPC